VSDSAAGIILKWDGISWTKQTIPTIDTRFNDVWVGGTTSVVAVGSNPTNDVGREARFTGTWSAGNVANTGRLYSIAGTSLQDLWAVDLHAKSPPQRLVGTQAREYGGRLSPDGRWLAYFSDETTPNQFQLYVTTLAPGGRRQPVGTVGAREAVWAKDGSELFFRQGRQMLSVRTPANGDFSSSRATVLFEGEYFSIGGPGIVHYDVSSDGQRFLMLKPVDEDRTPHLTVVQGLDAMIRDRLPAHGP
jgi:hypothetical protein